MNNTEAAKIVVTTFADLADAKIADILNKIEAIHGVSSVELIEGRVTIHGDRGLSN